MSGILFDNWTLQSLYSGELKKNEKIYNDLLEAIVLWDNIFYPDNSFSTWWKYISTVNELDKILKPLPDDEKLFAEESKKIFYSSKSTGNYTETVGVGGIRYSLLSNKNGIDYFPCLERSDFLSQNSTKKIILKAITRFELMNTFDNEVLKYYNDLNDFLGNRVIQFHVPILADFIEQNAPSNMSPIEYAIQLRMDKHVLKYREYLNEIEQAINNGQLNKLYEFKDATEELVHDIIKRRSSTYSITLSVLALPSINIEIPSLFYKKYIHLNFLRDLGKFIYNKNGIY